MIRDRLNTAIQFLKDGQSFSVGNLRIGVESENVFFVTGWTQYLNIENLNKKRALAELAEIKDTFHEMLEISDELNDIVKSKIVKFNLAFNYGMGSIGICSEKNGIIQWEANIKD